MNKKILIASILLVIAVLVFASCNKNKDKNDKTQENNTQLSTEANGEYYVTNTNGDHIPVTTGVDGAIELIDDLITKTPEAVSKEKEEIEKNKTSANTSAQKTDKNTTTTKKASSGSVVVGNESPIFDEGNAAVINW